MASRARRPLTRPAAFWDSSVLVPLYARQESTAQTLRWYKTYEVVVWWATPVEIAGALARLLRMKQLAVGDWRKGLTAISHEAQTWSVIAPSDIIRSRAIDLVEHYDLRAGDSLQLAAALAWCEDMPRGYVFLTGDEKLREAALLTGFEA